MSTIKHLGDICKLNGAEIPAVDVVTGGSPCQDLSVAGKRAGLAGERSGLFMEQVRVVKEMREHDKSIGRTGESVRPRYMVWENVPGAFSSNYGRDFQAVLEEIIKIAEPDAPGVPLPEAGRWSKSGCIYDEMGRWSLAWRVHDSQWWGVPQRRRRLSLVADLNGLTAPWLIFEPELRREAEDSSPYETQSDTGAESRSQVQPVSAGVSGDTEPCGETGETVAGGVGESAESAGRSGCLNPWDVQSKHIQPSDGIAETLYSGEARYGGGESYVMDGVDLYNGQITGDVAATLSSESCITNSRNGPYAMVSESPETICLEGNGSRESHYGAGYSESDIMYTLNTIEQHGVLPINASGVVSKGNGEAWLMDEKTTSVTSGGGQAGQGYPAALVSEPADTDAWTIDEKIGNTYIHRETANTLAARDYKQPQAVMPDSKALSFQERAGKPGGGKGILIQDEHTGALSTFQIQHVLSLETYHCESDKDKAMTLKARDYKDPQSVFCVQGESDG